MHFHKYMVWFLLKSRGNWNKSGYNKKSFLNIGSKRNTRYY